MHIQQQQVLEKSTGWEELTRVTQICCEKHRNPTNQQPPDKN